MCVLKFIRKIDGNALCTDQRSKYAVSQWKRKKGLHEITRNAHYIYCGMNSETLITYKQ